MSERREKRYNGSRHERKRRRPEHGKADHVLTCTRGLGIHKIKLVHSADCERSRRISDAEYVCRYRGADSLFRLFPVHRRKCKSHKRRKKLRQLSYGSGIAQDLKYPAPKAHHARKRYDKFYRSRSSAQYRRGKRCHPSAGHGKGK